MSSLRQLKEKFDRVLIKYTDKSCEVLLVDGLKVYTGKSKCHDNDNFDKKLGRTIALGRAEHAHGIAKGSKSSRESKCFLEGGCKYTSKTFGDVNQLDECIINFLPKNTKSEAS